MPCLCMCDKPSAGRSPGLPVQVGARLVVLNLSQQTDSSDFIGGFRPVEARAALNPLLGTFQARLPALKPLNLLMGPAVDHAQRNAGQRVACWDCVECTLLEDAPCGSPTRLSSAAVQTTAASSTATCSLCRFVVPAQACISNACCQLSMQMQQCRQLRLATGHPTCTALLCVHNHGHQDQLL